MADRAGSVHGLVLTAELIALGVFLFILLMRCIAPQWSSRKHSLSPEERAQIDRRYRPPLGAPQPENPRVFLTLSINGRRIGTVIIELKSNIAPSTADNFRQLCTHEQGRGYRKSSFHIIERWMVQGGDITRGDGTGGEAADGGEFPDENHFLSHVGAGIVAMTKRIRGAHEIRRRQDAGYGSQFYVTTEATPWLDGKNVVVGQVLSGFACIKEVQAATPARGRVPSALQVRVEDCGEVQQRQAAARTR